MPEFDVVHQERVEKVAKQFVDSYTFLCYRFHLGTPDPDRVLEFFYKHYDVNN